MEVAGGWEQVSAGHGPGRAPDPDEVLEVPRSKVSSLEVLWWP